MNFRSDLTWSWTVILHDLGGSGITMGTLKSFGKTLDIG